MSNDTTSEYGTRTHSTIEATHPLPTPPQRSVNTTSRIAISHPADGQLTATIDHVDLDYVRDGILHGSEPADWVDYQLRRRLADHGYWLDDYQRISVALPDSDDDWTHVTITCTVDELPAGLASEDTTHE